MLLLSRWWIGLTLYLLDHLTLCCAALRRR